MNNKKTTYFRMGDNLDNSPKNIYRWQIIISKMLCITRIGKSKWDITTHLWEWPKSRRLTTPNTVWSNSNSYILLMGGQNGTATVGEILAGCCWCCFVFLDFLNRTKHSLATHSSSTPRYLLNWFSNLCHKNFTWMFTVDLFIIILNWKQQRHP